MKKEQKVLFRHSAFLLLFLGFTQLLTAQTNYYVSASGNDANTGKSTTAAWKSLSKVNATSFVAGDIINFQRGSIFYGALEIKSKNGTSSNYITYQAYGTGNLPVIRASVAVTGWTVYSGNIWKTTLAAVGGKRIPSLYIDNVPKPLGREPNYNTSNGGFRVIKSHTANNSSISEAAALPYADNRFQGAEITIKTLNDLVKTEKVTSHSGATVNFSIANTADASINTIRDNFGYFFQNHVNALDYSGEWAHNISNNTLYLYSTTNPSTMNIERPSFESAVVINNSKYIAVNNIKFENGLSNVLALNSSSYINMSNCVLINGTDYITVGFTMSNITFTNNTLNQANNVGVRWEGCSGINFSNNSITNIGMSAGLGGSGYIPYTGIRIVSTSTSAVNTIEKNKLNNIGYHGLNFGGSNFVVQYNEISNYCTVKDDGGGIYTVGNQSTNTKIYKNIVHDALGAFKGIPAGSDPKTAGIYLDNNSQNQLVTENTVYNVGAWGIITNLSGKNTVTDNTMYNCGSALVSSTYDNTFNNGSAATAANNTFLRNILAPKTSAQYCASYKNKITAANFGTFLGTLNNNYYAQVITGGKEIGTTQAAASIDYTLATFKTAFPNYEVNGKTAPKKYAAATDPNTVIRFEVNNTASAKVVSLGTTKYVDAKSVVYQNSVSIPAYSSLVLYNSDAALVAQKIKRTVSEDENLLETVQSIKLYPSVATDFIVIEPVQIDDVFTIYTLSGAKVLCVSAIDKKETIDIKSLKSGLYIVTINGGKQLKFTKK